MSYIGCVGFALVVMDVTFFLDFADCCTVKTYEPPINDKALVGHVFKRLQLKQEAMCRVNCFLEDSCQSYNFAASPQDGDWACELSSTNDKQHPDSLVASPGKIYRATKNPCSSFPCAKNATCRPNFLEDDSFTCICPVGFEGQQCDTDVNECITETTNCSSNAVCDNVVGSFNCTCNLGFDGDGYHCAASKGFGPENPAASCAEVLDETNAAPDGPYFLTEETGNVQSNYCHMTDIPGCGGGGWTLVMKINGKKPTFHYSNAFWTNKKSFNLKWGGRLDDGCQTKLPSYWSNPFTKLCLGMKVGQNTRWIAVSYTATSLQSLLADGAYRPTNVSRDAWKSLIDGSSLQHECNMEGFNVNPSAGYSGSAIARIGIIANASPDCLTSDSRLGFGTGGNFGGQDNANTCGNEAFSSPDNGDRQTKAFCYILVQ